jgi:hypothetical protein
LISRRHFYFKDILIILNYKFSNVQSGIANAAYPPPFLFYVTHIPPVRGIPAMAPSFLQLKCYWRNIFTSCEHGFFYLLFEQPQAIKGMPNFKFSNVQSGIANAAYLPPIFIV